MHFYQTVPGSGLLFSISILAALDLQAKILSVRSEFFFSTHFLHIMRYLNTVLTSLQAILALVHDLGPNWELVSDVLSSNSQIKVSSHTNLLTSRLTRRHGYRNFIFLV